MFFGATSDMWSVDLINRLQPANSTTAGRILTSFVDVILKLMFMLHEQLKDKIALKSILIYLYIKHTTSISNIQLSRSAALQSIPIVFLIFQSGLK